jgi:hypothetical protein
MRCRADDAAEPTSQKPHRPSPASIQKVPPTRRDPSQLLSYNNFRKIPIRRNPSQPVADVSQPVADSSPSVADLSQCVPDPSRPVADLSEPVATRLNPKPTPITPLCANANDKVDALPNSFAKSGD